MHNSKEPTVWGVFVGEKGDQLEAFNSKSGPFPPDPGTEGYIAIGWPAIGDMRLYKDNYLDFVEKFRIVYFNKDERVFKTTANMVWNFAFAGAFKQTTPKSHRIFFNTTADVALNQIRASQF